MITEYFSAKFIYILIAILVLGTSAGLGILRELYGIILRESIVSSKGIKNFSLYSKRFSGALLTLAGLYIGMTNF